MSGEGEVAGEGQVAELQRWVESLFAREDEHLQAIREEIRSRGFPEIQLPAATARALQLLLRLRGARRVLEVGTLAGYSALWILRGLPADGRLVSMERDPERAAAARRLLERAGVADRLELLEGDAAELLPALEPPFDAVFLDADKEGLPDYVGEARRLLPPGGLLLVDNALWKGRVVDPKASDEATEAVRGMARQVAEDPGWDATILPVGDGLLVGLRL